MAIEFSCPYCTARVRVADDAAGKQGRCPKCDTAVMVPAVPTVPTVPEVDDESPPPRIEVREPSSLAARVRRRNRHRFGWLWPLVGCVGLGLVAAVLGGGLRFLGLEDRLTGELAAVSLDSDELPAGRIDPSQLDIDSRRLAPLIAALDDFPRRIRSQLMTVELGADEQVLEVRVETGPAARLIKVAIGSHSGLARYAEVHSRSLDDRRREQLGSKLDELLGAWLQARDDDQPFELWTAYRDSVGLAGMVGGLGFHVVAVNGRQEYSCVAQDRGSLYFLLPASVGRFEIRGRRLPDGSRPFSGAFTVRVANELP